jgi:hypothetical protein
MEAAAFRIKMFLKSIVRVFDAGEFGRLVGLRALRGSCSERIGDPDAF